MFVTILRYIHHHFFRLKKIKWKINWYWCRESLWFYLFNRNFEASGNEVNYNLLKVNWWVGMLSRLRLQLVLWVIIECKWGILKKAEIRAVNEKNSFWIELTSSPAKTTSVRHLNFFRGLFDVPSVLRRWNAVSNYNINSHKP